MITFQSNNVIDSAMKNLLLSIIKVNKYLSSILNYNEKFLSKKNEKELINILKEYNIPYDSLKYDSKILTDNPYYKNIKLDNIHYGNVKYEKTTIKKRTLMSMNFHQPLGKYLFHYHPLGYFDTNVDLPALKEGDKVWMSPAVSEIKSMQTGIDKGHGKCLTMGLGIGVLPYLWLLKDEVESVTIIEFNKDIINLFDTYIRPQFKIPKKLKIIHGDAFDYYREDFLNQFDYIYIDFWESTEDGLDSYIRLMEKNIDMSNIDYWIEDSILYDVKYIVALYLLAVYENRNISNFISSVDENFKIIANKINKYFRTMNETIKTEDELLTFIHNKEILKKILAM